MNKKKIIELLCSSVLTTNIYPDISVHAAEAVAEQPGEHHNTENNSESNSGNTQEAVTPSEAPGADAAQKEQTPKPEEVQDTQENTAQPKAEPAEKNESESEQESQNQESQNEQTQENGQQEGNTQVTASNLYEQNYDVYSAIHENYPDVEKNLTTIRNRIMSVISTDQDVTADTWIWYMALHAEKPEQQIQDQTVQLYEKLNPGSQAELKYAIDISYTDIRSGAACDSTDNTSLLFPVPENYKNLKTN